jgi:hypothetical protein
MERVWAGTFPTNTGLFAALLTGVVAIVVGLTYFPVIAARTDRRAAPGNTLEGLK